MKKKRMVLVMAVSAMCMMAGCGNTVKDGTEALEQGDYDTAIASFEEAAGSDDKEEAAEGYCGLGMTYYEQKQYDQALEMLEKAFDNGTVKTAELCNLAGTSALCKEDYAKALSISRRESHWQKKSREIRSRKIRSRRRCFRR